MGYRRRNSTLTTRKPLRRTGSMSPINRDRQARVEWRKWGPGGARGPWAIVLRARPCDTCGRGHGVPRATWEDLEWLALSPQSEISHVIARGMGAEPRVPAVGYTLSQCLTCHRLVTDRGGFGPATDAALKLAAALAWEARDHGLLRLVDDETDEVLHDEDPEVDRPPLTVAEYQVVVRELWTDYQEGARNA